MEITFHKKKAKAADYMKLPEGSLYQLINGELVMSPAPKKNHQDILREIILEVGNYLRNNPIGNIYPSPFDIHFDDENIFQPDICFISNEKMEDFHEDGYFYGCPDMVIEILSPSNAIDDFTRKFKIYEKYGVKEYVIIDPDTKDVIVYNISEGKFRERNRDSGILKSMVLNREFLF